MGRMKVMMAMAAIAFGLVVMVPEAADATRYIVGGKMGWATNVNYTIWAQDNHFYNGDWLFFVYDRNQMNVLEVNKTHYESCNSDHPIHNWTTRAGRDVVPLNVTRQYYFISGKGFCNRGMKLAILVETTPSPSPSPSPPPTSSLPPAFSPLNEDDDGSPTSIYRMAPASSPSLNEKSGSQTSVYRGQIVLPAVLFAIGVLWDLHFFASGRGIK